MTSAPVQSSIARYLKDPHAFRREQVVLPNGRPYDDCEEPWQAALWGRYDATDGDGNPRHHINYWELARGHAKTVMSAMAALTAGLLEDQQEVYFFAGDEEQAAIGLTMLTGMIRANASLASSFQIQKDRILVPSTGTVIRVMSSDAATAFGIGGTAKGLLVVVDEFWVWRSQMLWEAIISSTGKVGENWRVLILSNAGIDGESKVAWSVREACRSEANEAFYFWRSPGCVAGWISESWKPQQRALLTPGGYTRLIDNEWTSGESQFIELADWDALVGADLSPYPERDGERSTVFVGIDASKGAKKGADTTAGVAVRKEGELVRLVAHHIWKPTKAKGDIDLRKTVLPWLLDLKSRYRLRVFFDPYNMSTVAQMGKEAGLRMEELTQTQGNQTAFTGVLVDLVRSQGLRVYRADDLREHTLNAVMVETSRGIRLAKEKSSKKIDAAVALAMACWGAQEYGSRPVRVSRSLNLLEGPPIPPDQTDRLVALYGNEERVPEYAIDRD